MGYIRFWYTFILQSISKKNLGNKDSYVIDRMFFVFATDCLNGLKDTLL